METDVDEADMGNEAAEKTLAGYIARIQRQAKRTLLPAGACHNCGEPVRADLIFCDADCRADYDYAEDVQRRTSAPD